MILYFLRHGRASSGDPSDPNDDGRTLTEAGQAELKAAAPLWQRLNLRPDVVLSSPLPRALQTAELLVQGIGGKPVPTLDDRLRPGADWADMARAMASHRDARRVMFVGHEPDLSMAIQLLTGARAIRMRKGSVACVEFPGIPEPGAGELAWLLDPDLYVPATVTVPETGAKRSVTRVAAYALCVEDDRILLCRIAPGHWSGIGEWTLPGGGLDFGEAPAAGCLRELEEETGLVGEIVGLADVLDWTTQWTHPGDGAAEDFHAIQIVYRVRIIGGHLRDEQNGSTDAARWLTLADARNMPLVELAEAGIRLAETLSG